MRGKSRSVRLLTAVFAVLLLLPQTASAEVPYPAPGTNDPYDYETYAFATTPPSEDVSDRLEYSCEQSGDPLVDGNPQELYGVMGPCVTDAWKTTTGRPDVTIAVLDSGINWPEKLEELREKVRLNSGELPVPQGGPNPDDVRFGGYDVTGNGVFNIDDYAADTRANDVNGNGVLDPEDLVMDTADFADGTDDDGNGYIDDIAGWDFFENDNNARDEPKYGHGTGEARDSAAEANDGGDIGVCPNCMFVPLRVGDSFVADVQHFAEAVLYATDNDVNIVQEALGTLNNSAFAQQAVNYAWERGVVVVASAADEEAAHHNYPATYDHAMVVNAIRSADLPTTQPQSYLNLNGCTNFGGYIHVAVPGEQCSSEATGRASGMAGLAYSAALNELERGHMTRYPRGDGTFAPFVLSANEMTQLFRATADDIDFSTPAAPTLDPPFLGAPPNNYTLVGDVPSERYHSVPGWDQFFGYGRTNTRSLVERIAATRTDAPTIPPEADVSSPRWFETFTSDEVVQISGRVAANRASSFTYKVQWAAGVQPPEFPRDDVWHDAATGGPRSTPASGVLASIDTSDVQAAIDALEGWQSDPVHDPTSRSMPERNAFRVRIQVTDDEGNLGEDQKQFYVNDDPDLLDGFPKQLDADGASSPVFADIDDDGRQEIVLGTSNGEVHAFKLDGSELDGWPAKTDPGPAMTHATPAFDSGDITTPVRGSILAGAPLVADLDKDGDVEVVAADLEGKVYAWEHTGVRRAGFPVSVDRRFSEESFEGEIRDRFNRRDWGINAAPAAGDLDGNDGGKLEIVFGSNDSHVYAFNDTGSAVAGWPVLIRDPSKVKSVDADTHKLVFNDDAGHAIGTKILPTPSLGDIDGNGDLEVVVAVNEEYIEDPNFSLNNASIKPIIDAAEAADVSLDPGNGRLYALDHRGTLTPQASDAFPAFPNEQAFVPGWPFKVGILTTELLPYVGTGINGSPALADIDDDGDLEIATFAFAGPAYILDHTGVSIYGKDPEGNDISLGGDRQSFGTASDGTDAPALPALGGGIFTDMTGTGINYAAPGAGLLRVIDVLLSNHQFGAQDYQLAWNLDVPGGEFLPGFPHEVNDLQFFTSPMSADITGDDLPELIGGTAVNDVAATNAAGIAAPGWPKHTGGWTVAVAAVGDLDGDGVRDIADVTREGWLYVWKTAADRCGIADWPKAAHDLWNTSAHATDATRPGVVRDLTVDTTTIDATQIQLHWTAPGDDESCGTPDRVELRSSPRPIVTHADWLGANAVDGEPAPAPPGTTQSATVTIPTKDRYVAMRAFDDAGNIAALSNAPALPRTTPEISIKSVKGKEGQSGRKMFTFHVTLDRAPTDVLKVHFATEKETANARDFVQTSGDLEFTAGVTDRTVAVEVIGDRLREPDEHFLLRLSQAEAGVIVKGSAKGSILNDD